MNVRGAVTQLRTTDLGRSIRFYTETLGLELAFRYEDFYAGIRGGGSVFHLKQVERPDPSIAYVEREDHFHLYLEVDDVDAAARALAEKAVAIVRPPCDTDWGTRELVIRDDQGHTLYLGRRLAR